MNVDIFKKIFLYKTPLTSAALFTRKHFYQGIGTSPDKNLNMFYNSTGVRSSEDPL